MICLIKQVDLLFSLAYEVIATRKPVSRHNRGLPHMQGKLPATTPAVKMRVALVASNATAATAAAAPPVATMAAVMAMPIQIPTQSAHRDLHRNFADSCNRNL